GRRQVTPKSQALVGATRTHVPPQGRAKCRVNRLRSDARDQVGLDRKRGRALSDYERTFAIARKLVAHRGIVEGVSIVNGDQKPCRTWRRWAAEGGAGLDRAATSVPSIECPRLTFPKYSA